MYEKIIETRKVCNQFLRYLMRHLFSRILHVFRLADFLQIVCSSDGRSIDTFFSYRYLIIDTLVFWFTWKIKSFPVKNVKFSCKNRQIFLKNGNIFLKVVNLFKKILRFYRGNLPIFTGILFYNFYRKIYRFLIEKLWVFLQKT